MRVFYVEQLNVKSESQRIKEKECLRLYDDDADIWSNTSSEVHCFCLRTRAGYDELMLTYIIVTYVVLRKTAPTFLFLTCDTKASQIVTTNV